VTTPDDNAKIKPVKKNQAINQNNHVVNPDDNPNGNPENNLQ
jgi:hypothetical protein